MTASYILSAHSDHASCHDMDFHPEPDRISGSVSLRLSNTRSLNRSPFAQTKPVHGLSVLGFISTRPFKTLAFIEHAQGQSCGHAVVFHRISI
jgi:hypothetical protein